MLEREARMAENIALTLGKELEQLDREYANDFAGHSRLTRDLEQLDGMIRKAADIARRIEQIPTAARGAELARVHDAATQSLNLFKGERTAIVRAQEAGPVFERFGAEATTANFLFARYARHFAGKNRSTRDVALLGEIIDDLKQVDKRMAALLTEKKSADFERDHALVTQSLKQYQSEVELIEKAQSNGTPDERASLLATLANNQFAAYRVHFAGEPRVSRRPALLMRITSSLKKIREQMLAIRDGGLDVEYNAKNIGIVEERLGAYENELGEIRKVRQGTPIVEIMGDLGGSANKLFDEYRANFADKPRAKADDELLGNICDKLFEIRKQMVEMSFAEDNDVNVRNLDIVTEQLSMFEGEYEAVLRARAPQTAAAG